MGLTPIYGFPYPALTDSPNGPAQIQALAEAVEADLATTDATAASLSSTVAALPRGFVAQSTLDFNSDPYTTETMLYTLTFTAVASRRYVVHLNTGWSVPSVSTNTLRVRHAAGASVTIGATEDWIQRLRVHTAGAFDRIIMMSPAISGIAAGQTTIGISMANDDLVANGLFIAAGNNKRTLTVYDVGAA